LPDNGSPREPPGCGCLIRRQRGTARIVPLFLSRLSLPLVLSESSASRPKRMPLGPALGARPLHSPGQTNRMAMGIAEHVDCFLDRPQYQREAQLSGIKFEDKEYASIRRRFE